MSQSNQPGLCDPYFELISALADGEATPAEEMSVRTHVATCAACAEDLAYLLGASDALQGLTAVTPPDSLRMAILSVTTRKQSVLARLLGPQGVRLGLGLGAVAAALAYIALRDPGSAGPITLANDVKPLVTYAHPIPDADADVAKAVSEEIGAAPVRLASRPVEGDTVPAPSGIGGTAKTPVPKPGFVGSQVLLAQVPFDPTEADLGQKRRVESATAAAIEVADVPEETNEPVHSEEVATEAPVTKNAILTDDDAKKIKITFAREQLLKKFDMPSLGGSSQSSLTLFRTRF